MFPSENNPLHFLIFSPNIAIQLMSWTFFACFFHLIQVEFLFVWWLYWNSYIDEWNSGEKFVCSVCFCLGKPFLSMSIFAFLLFWIQEILEFTLYVNKKRVETFSISKIHSVVVWWLQVFFDCWNRSISTVCVFLSL